jgi:nucleoside-diphosphate-sugar epimerase
LRPGTYNLGTGKPMTVRELAKLVQESVERHTGRRPAIQAPDPRGQPRQPCVVRIDRLAAAGMAPKGTIADAVDETVQFCLRWKEDLSS